MSVKEVNLSQGKDQMVSNLIKQGEKFYKDNDFEKAKDVFEKILLIDPNHAEALNNIGVIAFQQDDLEFAISMFEQVYSIKRDYVESIENMGKCLEAKGEYHRALEWFERAFSLNKKSVDILNSIANCHVQLSNFDVAVSVYRNSLKLNPNQENINQVLKLLKDQTSGGKNESNLKSLTFQDISSDAAFLPQISEFSVNDSCQYNNDHGSFLFPEYLLKLFRIYSHELPNLAEINKERYNTDIFPTTGQYDLFESQILYMIIRDSKPKNVIEFSSNCGYSSIYTAMALRQNKYGQLHSFEIVPEFAEIAKRNASLFGLSKWVNFIIGDVKKVLIPYVRDNATLKPEVVFIDSDHSYPFAQWYINNLFPILQKGTLIHIHDVLPQNTDVMIQSGSKTELFKPSGENLAIDAALRASGYLYGIDYIYLNELTFRNLKWINAVKKVYHEFIPYRQGKNNVIRRMDRNGILTEWNATLWFKYIKDVMPEYKVVI